MWYCCICHPYGWAESGSRPIFSFIYYRQSVVKILLKKSDSAVIPIQSVVTFHAIRPTQESCQFVCSFLNRFRFRPVPSSRFNREFSYLRFGVIVDDAEVVLDHFYFPLCCFYYTVSAKEVNPLEQKFTTFFKLS